MFLVMGNNFFIIPDTRLEHAPAIPTGTPIKLVIDIYPLIADKTIKVLSIKSKVAMHLLSFLPIIFLSIIFLMELKYFL